MSVDMVYVSAWLTAALFFAARLQVVNAAVRKRLDQSGAVLLWMHILIAYVLTHDGSHSAAVEHVAIRTQERVGVRTGLGIYANFLVALLWTVSAFDRIASRSQMLRRSIEAFLWLMFLSASVLFANHTSAILFAMLSLIVGGSHFKAHRNSRQSVDDGQT